MEQSIASALTGQDFNTITMAVDVNRSSWVRFKSGGFDHVWDQIIGRWQNDIAHLSAKENRTLRA